MGADQLGAVLNMVGRQGKDARRFDQALAAQQEAISLLGSWLMNTPPAINPTSRTRYAIARLCLVIRTDKMRRSPRTKNRGTSTRP